MNRATIVIVAFVWFMILGFLVLASGCSSGDITFFSQTGNIGNGRARSVRQLPRQMTTRDLINHGRK